MTNEETAMIVDHALSMILDNDVTFTWQEQRAREILGREPDEDRENDGAWWDAKTQATNELLNAMLLMNNAGIEKFTN